MTEPPKPPRKAAKTAEAAPDPFDLGRLIRCLEQVEGAQWNHVGGKLCISRAMWADHGHPWNYRQASDPTVAREVAARALMHYVSWLEEGKYEASVKNLAKCWRHGWNGAMARIDEESDYANRVANLYNDKTWEPGND